MALTSTAHANRLTLSAKAARQEASVRVSDVEVGGRRSSPPLSVLPLLRPLCLDQRGWRLPGAASALAATPARVDERRSEWDPLSDYFYPPLLRVRVFSSHWQKRINLY